MQTLQDTALWQQKDTLKMSARWLET